MTRSWTVGVVVLVLGSVLAAVVSRRRMRLAGRFVARRAADRDARDQEALERWGDEGGAIEGGRDATFR